MNVKRVAWESRPVEHRTIPAGERLSGSSLGDRSLSSAIKTSVQEGASAPAVSAPASATDAVRPSAEVVPDRETIARIVEQVFAARGISRGAPKPDNPPPSAAPLPSAAAAVAPAPTPIPAPPKADPPQQQTSKPVASAAAPIAPPIEVAEFVCEDDARAALARNQKIFLGPKTIVTPSARDFGNSNDLFVVTDIIPPPKRKHRN